MQRIFIKESGVPFLKFPGRLLLGPEMKSTGEVMGSPRTSASPCQGPVRRRLRHPARAGVRQRHDNDKAECCRWPASSQMGWTILTTRGTADYLAAHGVPTEMVYKVNEGRPNCVDHIKSHRIDIVVNTPLGRESFYDDGAIRKSATLHGVLVVTTLTAAAATVRAIQALRERALDIVSLQRYTAAASYPWVKPSARARAAGRRRRTAGVARAMDRAAFPCGIAGVSGGALVRGLAGGATSMNGRGRGGLHPGWGTGLGRRAAVGAAGRDDRRVPARATFVGCGAGAVSPPTYPARPWFLLPAPSRRRAPSVTFRVFTTTARGGRSGLRGSRCPRSRPGNGGEGGSCSGGFKRAGGGGGESFVAIACAPASRYPRAHRSELSGADLGSRPPSASPGSSTRIRIAAAAMKPGGADRAPPGSP